LDEPERYSGTSSVALRARGWATGWRAYLAPDREEEPEGEIFMLCPECAERELGSLGWENDR
jgi:hypothetical protein